MDAMVDDCEFEGLHICVDHVGRGLYLRRNIIALSGLGNAIARSVIQGNTGPVPPAGTFMRVGTGATRSEKRRVGKEGDSTCRSRGSPDHKEKKHRIKMSRE